ncbi:uromodulin-like [Pseudophryne corroboree]|uniref:uromodulin-like n=1 Tax=Pseudophryne corroboree TaxID=495146 RepID=UPI003081E8B1
MYDDFIELKRVNSWLLDRVTARFPCGVRQYTMVEFNDPTIGPVRITKSKTEFDNFFNSLRATGGGDCPELAMGGLELALKNSPHKSFILVLTDASAKDYSNATLISNIHSLITTTQSQVFFLITGLCGTIYNPDFLIYRDVAALSFGLVFQVDLPDLNKVFNYLDLTLSRPANSSERLFSGEYGAGNNSGSFSVSNNFTALLITTDGVIYSIQVLGPDSIPLGIKTIVSETWGSMYQLNKPVHGRWTIIIYAGSHFSLRVEGLLVANISSADHCSECHPNATCEESLGFLQCSCKEGFIGDGLACSDIDECAYSWSNNCSVGICKNTFGSYFCVCPSGYTNSSGNVCVEIDECSSSDLNRCHSLATCITHKGSYSCVCPYGYYGDGFTCEVDECTRGACGLGINCVKTLGSYQCSDPCEHHIVLNETWRSISNVYGSQVYCDGSLYGWHRFIGSGGVRIPDTCVPIYSCGTHAPMWLNGSHPMLSDGIINRTACANWNNNCCYWSSTVQIKACPDGYYVYKLSGTPACSLSYCTDPHTSDLLCEADEEWKLKDGIYGCYCKDEYEVSDVADIRPELTCGVHEMKVTFYKCQLKSLNLNVSSITLKDSSCFEYRDDPITNTFSVLSSLQAGKCGLQIIKNSTHAMYENTLDFVIIKYVGIIERREELTVRISCAYPLDMLTSLTTVVNPFFSSTNISIGGTGEFKAYMALYKDSSYLTPYEGSNVLLSTSSILYVGVFVKGGDSSQHFVVMKSCYATPTESPDDSMRYYLIIDSCPNKQDSTISVLENGASRKGRFSAQVFKFIGNYNNVYLHCAINLCDDIAGSCTPSCSGVKLRNAASDQTYQLTLGPVIREDSPTPSGSVGTRPTCALLGLVLFLLVHFF